MEKSFSSLSVKLHFTPGKISLPLTSQPLPFLGAPRAIAVLRKESSDIKYQLKCVPRVWAQLEMGGDPSGGLCSACACKSCLSWWQI